MLPRLSDNARFHAYEYARHHNELVRLMRDNPNDFAAQEKADMLAYAEARHLAEVVLEDMGVGFEARADGLVTWLVPEGVGK